ncbi:MAG: hypothetical protein M0P91_04895 [Sulfuricurvum sp.]|jgi:hypothetical protein|uniref:hypothetical protein n=1 Tax=Sulfuricurvum sp. TaxID=2025608 RepID=UPI002600B471|nr:hypothetical protein [Sulfuricurvum sp.]MCK9372512.1 hypothetical protein [Sulfuricurvum sp.]
MIEATLAEIRKPETLYAYQDEIVHIIDGRKKVEVGYFVPKSMAKEFAVFIDTVEKAKKRSLLERIAKAQAKDPIEEGSIADGIL